MDFSVIIPTFNRVDVLGRTLQALSQQKDAPDFEVIVVDDGSTDRTAETVRGIQRAFPVPLSYYYQNNRRQGAARNLAARHATGERLLFIGDDTVPVQTLVSEHAVAVQGHATCPALKRKLAVLGRIYWPPSFTVTRFLQFIGEHGWQFGFSLIDDPDDVPFNFFYTSNISVDRALFIESGGFDESFNEYGWEDIELSLRLKRLGMKIIFWPRAEVFHYHPTTLRTFRKRQERVGASAWSFLALHPETVDFLGLNSIPRYTALSKLRMELLTLVCRLTESSDWFRLDRYYPDLLSYYYFTGVIRKQSERGSGQREAGQF